MKQPTVPNYLAPQTPQQIKKTATTTIAAAYKPAKQDLNHQQKQAQAISDKRSADNKYYLAWLNTQEQALQAHADAANTQLVGMEQGFAQQQAQLFNGQQPGLVAGADARSGNVSNNAQSTALNQTVTQNQALNAARLGSTSQSGLETISRDQDMLGAVRLNSSAAISAADQKQLSDLQTTLSNIASARTKLFSSQAADTQKEIGRLGGIEIQKAQSNRDYQAALVAAGVKTAEIKSLMTARTAATALNQKKFDLALTKAQQAQANSDRTYQLNKGRYGLSVAKDQYEREHGLGPYRPVKGTPAHKPLTQSSQNTIYNRIDKTTGLVEQLINTYGLSPQAAYHLLQNGGYVNGPTHTTSTGKTSTSPVHFNPVGDVQILNAAYNLRSGGSGLSPGDIRALKAMGLATPEKRYSHYSNPNTPGTGYPH